MNRIDWLAQRRLGIGGTGISTILGLNPYKTNVDLYLEIIEGTETPMNAAMQRGKDLEELVAQKFAEQENVTLIKPEQDIYVHPMFDFIRGSIDRFYVNGSKEKKILECKTTSKNFDECPEMYKLQLMYYLGITGYSEGAVSILDIPNWKLENYYFERNNDLIEWMQSEAEKFWTNHIIPKIPPEPIDNIDALKLYKNHIPEKVCEYGDGNFEDFEHYRKIKEQIKILEKEAEDTKIGLMAIAKDAELIQYKGQTIATIKTHSQVRFDSESFKKEKPELYKEYQKTISYPVFRLK
jgi:putative phage-type endonuclease